MTTVKMTARKPFTNPRVSGPREGGHIVEGDSFSTDWLHARELRHNGLAEPVDASDLDTEPDEPLQPHNQISQHALETTNARRFKARSGGAGAVTEGELRPTGAGPTTVADRLHPAGNAPMTTGKQSAATSEPARVSPATGSAAKP